MLAGPVNNLYLFVAVQGVVVVAHVNVELICEANVTLVIKPKEQLEFPLQQYGAGD